MNTNGRIIRSRAKRENFTLLLGNGKTVLHKRTIRQVYRHMLEYGDIDRITFIGPDGYRIILKKVEGEDSFKLQFVDDAMKIVDMCDI